MTHIAHAARFNHSAGFRFRPGQAVAKAATGFLRRIYDALLQSNRRRAERDVARLLQSRGGRFTDSIEREIEEHTLGRRWNRFP
jgi:hypothetical protein